jgi:hypothetical protein
MKKLFPWVILVAPFLLFAACGDDDLGVRDGGGTAPGAGGAGSGGIPGAGGSSPGAGGIPGSGGSAVGTGGSILGNGGVTGSGGILGSGGSSLGSGGATGLGGTASGGQTSIDASVLDSTGPDSPLDALPQDVLIDGREPIDGDSCQAPKVWRYQQPGCGADARPVCGGTNQDGCLRYACACDGEILDGCDYYSKPWRSQGICPDFCVSPQTFYAIVNIGTIPAVSKGCACNPASDAPVCMRTRYRSVYLSCVGGTWTFDQSSTCTPLDAATGG